MWWGQGSDLPEQQPEAPPQNVEVKELQEQFEQQQTQIAQLKELLRKNQQQLVTKEKEVEEYATKLSGIKSRVTKRGRNKAIKSISSVEEYLAPDPAHPEVITENKDVDVKPIGKRNVQRGNLILLRKQLEENRIRCEQRNKEVTQSKRGIEEMVEQLRSQVEERELTIQELKGEFGSKLLASSLPQVLPNIDVSQTFIIPQDMPPERQIQELYTQISLRDNRISDLNGKIMEMENNVVDLQENLKEKDSVIEARTKAITLMSEDLSRKSKATLDTLDETREEMRTMQQNFVVLETNMKREKEDLNKQLEAKGKRLQQMEERNRMLESTRFELSTRNAELQEKIVHLQTELQNMSAEIHTAADVKVLEEELEDAKKEILNLKSAATETKMLHSSEEIEQLHHRIAELEEDKGSEDHWKKKVSELEDRVKQQNHDLDSHLHALSILETEKLDLIQGLQEKTSTISFVEAKIKTLEQMLSETENAKVSAEMKAVELEEQLDMLLKEKSELVNELENTKNIVQGQNQPLESVELFSCSSVDQFEKWQTQELSEKEEKDSSNMEISLKPLEYELEQARKIITEQKDIISELSEKLRQREEDMELQQEMISKLEHLGEQVQDREERSEDDNKISDIVKELGEMAGDLNEWKKRCSEVEDRLEQLGNEKVRLENHLEEVINENQLINTQLKFHKEIAEDLEEKLKEQFVALAARDEAINKLKDTVKEQQQALESKGIALLEVSQKLRELEAALDKQHLEIEAELQHKTHNLEMANGEIVKLQTTLRDMELEATNVNSAMVQLSEQIDGIIKRLGIEIIDKHENHLIRSANALTFIERHYGNLASEIQGYNNDIFQQNGTIQELREKLSEMENIASELERNIEIQKVKDVELHKVREELSRKSNELSSKDEDIKKLQQEISDQVAKNKKLAKCLKAKAVLVRNYEEKERLLEATSKSKEQESISLTSEHISQLESKVSLLSKQLEDKNDIITKYSDKCGEYEREILMFTDKCMDLQQQINLETEEKNCVCCKLNELNEQMTEKEKSISVLMQTVESLQEELTSLKQYKTELIGENIKISKKYEEAENKLQYTLNSLSVKESDFTKMFQEIEKLTSMILEKDRALSQITMENERLSHFEAVSVQKNERISELEEQIQCMAEKHQTISSAIEAKLQEKEAYVEGLEQELSKTRERAAHLEEGLFSMEERRKSLEGKFEALRDMLMEADRKKEEVEESEEILEGQLSNLMARIEMLKKRLAETEDENTDLNKRICDTKIEYECLKKSVSSAEMTTKNLQKEVERLSTFEASYGPALERIESLEAEIKQKSAEFTYSLKEITGREKLYKETLESDLLSLNKQLELSESEKRSVTEQMEKLNDIKNVLEEEIDFLKEHLRLSNEKIVVLEEEIRLSSSRNEHIKRTSNVCQVCNQNMQQELINTFDINISKNDERIVTEVCKEDQIKNLSTQIDSLKTLLRQKDNDLNTYQQRLLQLQFGAKQDSEPATEFSMDVGHSVTSQEAYNVKVDKCVPELSEQAQQLKLDLLESQREVEDLKCKIMYLENEIKDKEAKFHLQSNSIEELLQLKKLCGDYEERISLLQQEKTQIYVNLIRVKSENEVSEIIQKAVEYVETNWDQQQQKFSTVLQLGDEMEILEKEHKILRDQLMQLETELKSVKAERDVALEKIGLNANMYAPLEDSASEVAFGSYPTNQNLVIGLEEQNDRDVLREAFEAKKSVVLDLHCSPLETSDMMETIDDDDGWGWGVNEARLEEEHIQKQQEAAAAVDTSNIFKTHVADLENQIRELEKEKIKLSEELQSAQMRNGKLLKKLKDFKLKNENLMRENQELALKTSDGFCNLDSAIEDELKIQIDALEKEVKDCRNERDLARLEKESLSKRVDVLTTANERYLEMKEKQDVEAEMKDRKNRELSNEIEALHWKISELTEEGFGQEACVNPKKFLTNETEASNYSKVDELEQQVAALAADNESLQMLLEEQRNLRLQIENAYKNNNGCVMGQNDEAEELKIECKKLKDQYGKACAELEKMSSELNKYIDIENEYMHCIEKLNSLETANNMLLNENQKLLSQLELHEADKADCTVKQEKISAELQEVTCQNKSLEEENCALLNNCFALKQELNSAKEDLNSLSSKLQTMKAENISLEEKLLLQETKRIQDIENLRKEMLPEIANVQETRLVVKMERETQTEYIYPKTSVTVQTDFTSVSLEELDVKINSLVTELKMKRSELETLQTLFENERSKYCSSEKQFISEIEWLKEELGKSNEIILRERNVERMENETQEVENAEYVIRMKNELATIVQNYEEILTEKKQEIHHLQLLIQRKEEPSFQVSYKQLEEVISSKEKDIIELKLKLLDMEQKFQECLFAKNQDIENERQRIYECEREMENLILAKDEDIQNLRILLAEKERLSSELMCTKEDDIKNLKIKIADKDTKINCLTESLHKELEKIAELEQKVTELERKVDETEIENQILKEQIASGKHYPISRTTDSEKVSEELPEAKQSDLDAALYMLHQRDVRCDELTLELMQLLEERDTLQLRLSNALKVNEELRNKFGKITAASTPVRTLSLSSKGNSLVSSAAPFDQIEHIYVPVEKQGFSTQPEETEEDLQALADKLSQLHSIDYRRDVTLKDESEQRHSEQMQLLQPRGNSIVLDASYTLSRDVQSPSTVLLNWIRGRSTPKVMHI